MKSLNNFKFLLVALIGLSSFSMANAQCSSSFTSVDNGSGIISFTNTSTGNFLSYYWEFGDGNNTYSSNPQHQYTTNGGYSVCLTIYDSISQCTSTFCDSIVIVGLPNPCNITAGFTYVDNGNGNYTFTNTSSPNANSYSWLFAGLYPSNLENPNFTFPTNGNYQVRLTVSDSLGCNDLYVENIQISSVPPCTLTASISYVDNGNNNYSFTPSISGGTAPYQYLWAFDGVPSYLENPNHTFPNNANGGVSLHVYANNCGASDTTTITIDSSQCNISSGFTFVDHGNGDYTFNNSSTGGSLSYYWNFGDGNTSSNTNPNHTYIANGTYPVQLMVFDMIDSNCYDILAQTIQVSNISNPIPCFAAFVLIPDTPAVGNLLVYNSSVGNNLTYFWDFGDGNTSILAYPNYTYSTNGPFELCLTVDNGNGCTNTYCDSIDSGGLILKQSGFTINVQAPIATGIENKSDLISNLNTYPNPVKNNLNIELNLTKQTQVEIVASDMIGNIVKTIANGNMNSGMNNIKWNTNNLPNGLYLLTIKFNNSIKVKKIVINK